MRRFLKVMVCLSIVLCCGPMVAARPHHSTAKHVQSPSDAGDTDTSAVQSDNTDGSDTSTATDSADGASADATDSSHSGKVTKLANLEALVNIMANLTEIIGLAVGGPLLLFGVPAGLALLFMKDQKDKRWLGALLIAIGLVFVAIGLAASGVANWLCKTMLER